MKLYHVNVGQPYQGEEIFKRAVTVEDVEAWLKARLTQLQSRGKFQSVAYKTEEIRSLLMFVQEWKEVATQCAHPPKDSTKA
jgi:hypothetical protein